MRKPPTDPSLVALGRVTRPVGLNGGVRVQLLCDGPERIRQVQQFLLGVTPMTTRPMTLREVSARENGVVVFFEECVSRTEAESLRGHYLFIPASDSVAPSDGRPLLDQLLECDVKTSDGRTLGRVSAVYELPSHRLMAVAPEGGGEEVLVPEVDAWVLRVDVQQKVVVLVSDELFGEE